MLSQQAVDPTTNEAKAALDLLKTIVLQGRLISGNDYLFIVKDNQSDLKAAIEAEFQPGFSPRDRATTAAVTF